MIKSDLDLNPHKMGPEADEWRWTTPDTVTSLGELTPRQAAIVSHFEDAHLARCDAPTMGNVADAIKINYMPQAEYFRLMLGGWLEEQPLTYYNSEGAKKKRRYRLTQAAIDRLDRRKRIEEANRDPVPRSSR